MHETLPGEQTAEQAGISELIEAANILVNKEVNFLERIQRDKEVTVKDNVFELSQSIELATKIDGEPRFPSVALPTDDAEIDNKWFRNHLNQGLTKEVTSLVIASGDMYSVRDGSRQGGSWFVPKKESRDSKVSNYVLLDPLSNALVTDKDSSAYPDKWEEVVSWVLDELDHDSDITHTRAWLGYDIPENLDTILNDEKYYLFDVVRYKLIKSLTEASESDIITMLMSTKSEAQTGGNFLLRIQDNNCLVIKFGAKTDNEPINAFDFDPELIYRAKSLIERAA